MTGKHGVNGREERPGEASLPLEVELARRYQSVFETATDGIIVITAEGIIESVNTAVERLFDYCRDELVGSNVSILMPEPFRSQHDGYIRRFIETGRSKIIGVGREVVGQRKDGSTFPMHLSVGQMEFGSRRMFTGFVHDLEPRRHLEEELTRVEAKLGALAQEAALRRVAMAVAREVPPEELMDLVSEEIRRLLSADVGMILARDAWGLKVVGAAFDDHPRELFEAAGATLQAHLTEDEGPQTIALDTHGEATVRAWAGKAGLRTGMVAPLQVRGRYWGLVVAATGAPGFAHPNAVRLLTDFADLASLAIGNYESKQQLRHLATTDPLTGLTNHRVFHETLARSFREARSTMTGLALAIFDVDWFKSINDRFGHQTGDQVLKQIASSLRLAARRDDTLARIGGEEFAWLMPGADSDVAIAAASRFCEDLAQRHVAPLDEPVRVSGGVACMRHADTADELVRFADQALYSAKNSGRGRLVSFSPEMPDESSSVALADQLRVQEKLRSLRMISRAVDARDHGLRWHSERVADVAVALAVVLGWSPPACARLHETGLVHDVGKIGIPDSILLKPGPLLEGERATMETHVAIGVDLLRDVLDPEQLSWVASHHERWSGGGYPQGLVGESIPEGGRLLALADAWDVMTSDRVYNAARTLDDAAEECSRLAGSQFWPKAVDALVRLIQSGSVPGHGDGAAVLEETALPAQS
jgi:diguanylate cyclase (GGDEF)-like protein/PAS domain S-box-containing protein